MPHSPVFPQGTRGKIPRFSTLGVVVSGVFLYFLLTFFVMFMLYVRSASLEVLGGHSAAAVAVDKTSLENFGVSISEFLDAEEHMPKNLRPLGFLLRFISIATLVCILLYHSPLATYFSLRRRQRKIPENLQKWCELLAQSSARFTAVMCFLAAAADSTISLLRFSEIGGRAPLYLLRSVPFYAIVAILISSFIFYWQNYRIRILYSPFIFIRSGFVRESPRTHRKSIKSQITLSMVITALLPMTLVVFYLVAYISSTDFRALTADQRSILLGDFLSVYPLMEKLADPQSIVLPYLSALDTVSFISGIVSAFVISALMLSKISKWSTLSIAVPLQELQRNVMRTSQGDFSAVTSVRDTDEVGELTENINSMLKSLRESERLRSDKESAEEANRAKSAFLANMSHELRTPLNAILGFAQLLARGENLTEEQRENVKTISQSGAHLLSLINDVLDMSKIEAGRVEAVPAAFDLHEMLAGLESMFSVKAEEKGLNVVFDFPSDLPRFVVSDAGKLRQILVNLIGNAVKFTGAGGVTLRVKSGPEAAGALRLFFEVEDTGIGIPAEEIDSLFKPFVQSRGATESAEGTGLGLSICRAYVGLLGGTIAVKSEPGKGSVFSFDIRVEAASETSMAPAPSSRRITGLVPGQPLFRILIAEDKDSNRDLLMKLLVPLGFDVRGAKNGAECVSLWESWEPHLIWMDMRMPVMDGYEATRRIKSTVKGQATVIIALTASAFERDKRVILSDGCDDFVRKPFVEEEIYGMLEKHLGVKFSVEDTVKPAKSPSSPSLKDLAPELLKRVSPEWKEGFKKALVEADYACLKKLTDDIRMDNPEAAEAIDGLLSRFEYEKITSVFGF